MIKKDNYDMEGQENLSYRHTLTMIMFYEIILFAIIH